MSVLAFSISSSVRVGPHGVQHAKNGTGSVASPAVLADVIRARAAYHSFDPEHDALTVALEALAEYVEDHAPGTSRETLTTLETQAARHEVVFGFPDLGGRASAALDVAAGDHAEKLREVAALALLDAYEELRANTLSLPRS